jgi:restriction endonuclease S subunit
LDGLEAVEMKLSEVLNDNDSFRFDSEFFKKKYLHEECKRKDCLNIILGELSFITDGQHGYHEVDENSNIHHLTAKNAKNWFSDTVGADKIAKWVDDSNQRSSLKERDIILSTRGSVGYCALVVSSVLPANIDQDVARIALLDEKIISAEYLLTYLNSAYGKDWILRNSTGMVQQGLSLARVRMMPIPVLNTSFQEKINNIIKLAFHKIEQSKSLYTQAETLLLKTLGLDNFTSSTQSVNIKSFKDSFGTTGRLDAEYYQPKYDDIEGKINNYANGCAEFSLFIKNFSTGYPYKSEDYIEVAGVALIRINNIKKGFLDTSNVAYLPNEQISLSEKDIANEGDVLISMSGTIGNSCVIPKSVKALINQRIMRITTQNYNPLVLMLLINSIVGEFQLEKVGTGGVQTNISSNDISKIIIPIFEEKIQIQIAELVQHSFALKKESEQLLERAKQAVELAIEQGEEVAMAYLGVVK